MRCWHPRAENVIKEVINYNPKSNSNAFYPQYSAATSGSSIKEWNDICKKNNFNAKTSTICCYQLMTTFAQLDEITKKISNIEKF